jgi:hypothetical protein
VRWVIVLLLAFLLAGALRQLGLLQLRPRRRPGALGDDFLATCDIIQKGLFSLKALVGAAALLLAAARSSSEGGGMDRAPEHPYRDAPAFSVDRIDLDGHKLLTNHITR